MVIDFSKMHGTMNDFVVYDDMNGTTTLSRETVIHICDRRRGVGADGVIVVRPGDNAPFFMDYVNADGSLAEMCGNGIRCLAKYVYDRGMTSDKKIRVSTRAGVKELDLITGPDGTVSHVRVNMGAPIFEAKRIPVNIEGNDGPILDRAIDSEGRTFAAAALSMGNPHCVIVTDDDDIDDYPVQYGPAIEKSPLFPAKANVEFVRVESPNRMVMRVWERGSGETMSCGTGACAAAVVCRLKNLTGPQCVVELRGGDLSIAWDKPGDEVLMTGPAVTVFTGRLNL